MLLAYYLKDFIPATYEIEFIRKSDFYSFLVLLPQEFHNKRIKNCKKPELKPQTLECLTSIVQVFNYVACCEFVNAREPRNMFMNIKKFTNVLFYYL